MRGTEGLGVCPGLLASLVPFLGTVLCEQGQAEGGFGALWGSMSPLALCSVPWPARGKVSAQPQQLPASLPPPAQSAGACATCWVSMRCTLYCVQTDGRMDRRCAGAGQADKGRRCWGGHPSPRSLPGWLGAGKELGEGGGGLAALALTAPCGRALPEASRQRVAELHGAASNTNHCVLPWGSPVASAAVLAGLRSRLASSSPATSLANKNYEAHLSQFLPKKNFSSSLSSSLHLLHFFSTSSKSVNAEIRYICLAWASPTGAGAVFHAEVLLALHLTSRSPQPCSVGLAGTHIHLWKIILCGFLWFSCA